MIRCQGCLLIDRSQIRVRNIFFDVLIKKIEIPVIVTAGFNKGIMDQVVAYGSYMKGIILCFLPSCCLFLLLIFDRFLLLPFLALPMYGNSSCCDKEHYYQQGSKGHHPPPSDHLTAASGSGHPPSSLFFPESFFLLLPPSSFTAPAVFTHNFIPFPQYDNLPKILRDFRAFFYLRSLIKRCMILPILEEKITN